MASGSRVEDPNVVQHVIKEEYERVVKELERTQSKYTAEKVLNKNLIGRERQAQAALKELQEQLRVEQARLSVVQPAGDSLRCDPAFCQWEAESVDCLKATKDLLDRASSTAQINKQDEELQSLKVKLQVAWDEAGDAMNLARERGIALEKVMEEKATLQTELESLKKQYNKVPKVEQELRRLRSELKQALHVNRQLHKQYTGERGGTVSADWKVQRQREARTAASIRPGYQLYHVILQATDLIDLTTHGWSLLTARGFHLDQCKGIPVTVLGGFNKGKTWLLTQLGLEVELQTGFCEETQGISFRVAKLKDNRDAVFIDTAGSGQALHNWTREASDRRLAMERLLAAAAFDMAEIYLYITDLLEEQDQRRVDELLKQVQRERAGTPVVVVHNLKSISCQKEWKQRKEDLVHLLSGGRPEWHHLEYNVPDFNGEEGMVDYLSGPDQRHYFLGRQGCDSGKKNNLVMKAITDFIGSATGRCVKIQEKLATGINKFVNAHLTERGTVEVLPAGGSEDEEEEEEEDVEGFISGGFPSVTHTVIWKPDVPGRIPEAKDVGEAPLLPGLQSTILDREPPTKVLELIDNQIVVQIGVPGVVRSDIDVRVKRKNEVSLVITGRRVNYYEGVVRSVLKDNVRLMTDFEVVVPIPPSHDVPKRSVILRNMMLHDGLLTLAFTTFDDGNLDGHAAPHIPPPRPLPQPVDSLEATIPYPNLHSVD